MELGRAVGVVDGVGVAGGVVVAGEVRIAPVVAAVRAVVVVVPGRGSGTLQASCAASRALSAFCSVLRAARSWA